MQINLAGTQIDVTKHMLSEPRRIGKIEITLRLPGIKIEEQQKALLQKIGDNCPVLKSLNPGLEVVTEYVWE